MTEAEKVIRYLKAFEKRNYFPDNLMLAIVDYTSAAAAHDIQANPIVLPGEPEPLASESDGQ